MNGEESFEPDYTEDEEDVLDEELLLSGVEDKTATEQHHDPTVFNQSELAPQHFPGVPTTAAVEEMDTDEEILQGDGFFYEENVERVAEEPQLFVEEDLRSDCEKSIKMALMSKQWSDLEAVFRKVEPFPNLRESLSFFCADQLKSATEFMGLMKQLKSSCYGSVALVGCKLIINADLCSNHAAGIMILKMMVDEGVTFHDLTIRMFSSSDVVKSAVAICTQQKDYSLLCNLLEKSDFFGLRTVEAEDLCRRGRIFDFNSILQKLFDVLESMKDRTFQLASTCLTVLRIALDGNCVAGEVAQYSHKVWPLCVTFISGNKLEELAAILDLSLRYDDLIAWNHSSRKAVLTYLLSRAHEVDKIYKAGKAFVDINHKNGSTPKFVEFGKDCKTLTLFSSMSEEEMKLALILFAKTAKDHIVGKSAKVAWEIRLTSKSLTSVEYNEANKKLSILLSKKFKNLSFLKEAQGYSVIQCLDSSKTSRPFLKGKSKASLGKMKQSVKTGSVQQKTMNQLGKLGQKHGKSVPATSSINPAPNVPSAVKKHPRFAGIFSKSSDLNTNPDVPSAVSSHPRFAKPRQLKNSDNKSLTVPNKALFSRSMNRLMATSRTKVHLSNPRANFLEVPDVHQRLKAHIGQRLSYLANNGLVSTTSARVAMASLPDNLLCRLPTDHQGNVVYDSAEVQTLLEPEIRSMMNGRR